ncbi:hypothetical protein CKO51_01860 [Rhodopirellula sp. SM50]|nr:hypothetical protein [Rhodopirellula sp. SM50]PAY21349.1 hypothetical protein CKO51_01860 [Rhodopirellula sp. SM50]
MDAQVISTVISGVFAIAAALGSIVLKHHLDRRKVRDSIPPAAPVINPYEPPTVPETLIDLRSADPRAKPSYLSRKVLLIPIATVVVGTVLGIVSRLLRPYANVGGTHYEALAALVILLVGCLVLINVNRLGRGFLGHLLYQLENLAMWSGFACGWSLVHGYFWGDLIGLSIAWWFGCSVFGSVVLAVFQSREQPTVVH